MTGYILYGRPGSGNMAVEAALVEAGVPHELVEVSKVDGGRLDPSFLKLNPRGQVPALQLPDGSVMTESAAMLLHLADAFPASGLAPAPGSSARAQHDRWLTFAHANFYEGMLRLFYSDRYVSDPAAADSVKAAAGIYLMQQFAIYEGALGAGPYTFGDKLQMVDLMIWMMACWSDLAALEVACPKVVRLYRAVQARPELAGVIERNG